MTCTLIVDPELPSNTKDKAVVRRDGLLHTFLSRLSQSWPVTSVMRALNGFWWLLGLSPLKILPSPMFSPPRQHLAVRKRLSRITRLVLAILPHRVQGALGFPVCTSIGCSVSPEVSSSPTKPCGKGCKRKYDTDDDDDDDDDEHQSWVEVLNQELAEEDCKTDPDYEPSTMEETDSEEYHTHNDTESSLEIEQYGNHLRIKELTKDIPAEA
ncbi:oogenesis-related [Scleropages formosus]|uniref:oogenesis-related n=1 Tax=Scleropages formosus TaxID=113540 RepID=UPI0010FABF8C|nr:uncharacterized protein LOC108919854 [Scleropages formosus]